MRTVVQLAIGELMPHRGDFINFARVRVNNVLQQRQGGARNLVLRNGGIGVHSLVL